MFDPRWIRDNPDEFDAGLKRRGLDPLSPEVLELDKTRRAAQTQAQDVQSRRNAMSKQVGAAKAKGEDATAIIAEVSELKVEQARLEEALKSADQALKEFLQGLPNIPAPDVPEGPDETANLEVRQHGAPPSFDFDPKQHFEIGEAMGRMDFETAAKLSGARFVVLSGQLARLERAISAFMLDLHTKEFGYTEVSPPILVRDTALFGTGQLPKFAEDLYRTEDDYWLIPTGEGAVDQSRRRLGSGRGRLADTGDRTDTLLPIRGRRGRAGHSRYVAPAPVQQG